MSNVTRTIWLLLTVALVPIALLSNEGYVQLLAPMAMIVIVVTWFWTRILAEDKRLPIHDVGSVFICACAIYSLVPSAMHIWRGGVYAMFSAAQFVALSPDMASTGGLLWWYAVFIASFCLMYASMRKSMQGNTPNVVLKSTSRHLLLLVFGSLAVGFEVLKHTHGLDFEAAYSPNQIVAARTSHANFSLLSQQILHNAYSMGFVAELGVLVVLFSRWKTRKWRLLVYAWLLWTVLGHLGAPGPRTPIILTFWSVFLLRHIFVRPWRSTEVIGATLLAASWFVGVGVVRGGDASIYAYTGIDGWSFPSFQNEFENAFAGTWDLFRLLSVRGDIADVPWQVR